MKSLLRPLIILMLSTVLAHHAQAQNPDIPGDWTLILDMPDGKKENLPLRIELKADSLQLFALYTDGLSLLPMSFENGRMKIDIDFGHAEINCVLYVETADEFAGICEGPRAELPAVLSRTKE